MIRKVGLVSVALLAFAGCGKQEGHRQGIESDQAVKAPARVEQSFAAVELPAKEAPTKKELITLAKASLDKEFLLQSILVSGVNAPSFENLKSRVVAFKRDGSRLFMLEATQGHRITNEIELPLVLVEFPIVAETDTQLTFDFNAGMDRIFVAGDWYVHDIQGAGYQPQFTSVRTRVSYIDSAKVDAEKNRFVISQVAQLAVGIAGSEKSETVQVRYYLSPYQPDPGFEPVRVKDFEQFGYFEVMPQLKSDGGTVIRAAKFNGKKDIVYAVSSNTPAEFKQAVKEGVLYWNKVFGEERVKVVEAAPGVSAPDADLNIVQWVDYDRAGFAYADAQMDPRTGEVLHAQVYMTSAFATLGKVRMRDRLRRMATELSAEPAKRQVISLAGFYKERLCDYDEAQALAASAGAAASFAALLESDASDAKILKVAQDYVRAVVAHEVGHTLGLRHNFAGSLATNYPLSQRQELFASYVRDGDAPKGVVASSTVMDYTVYEEDAIIGDQLAKLPQGLEYDNKAIGALYKGKTYKNEEVPLFCTDSDMARYLDCRQFDTGASNVEFAAWNTQTKLETLAYALLESYVSLAKEPFTGNDAVPVAKIGYSADTIAANLLANRYDLYRSLLTSSSFLSVRHAFPYINDVNRDEVRKAEVALVKGEVAKLGGMAAVFAPVPADFGDKLLARFSELLGTPAYSAFTREEAARMKATVRGLSEKLGEALAKVDLKTLAGAANQKLVDDELSDQFSAVLQERLVKYVFSVEEGKDLIVEVQLEDSSKKEEPKAGAEPASTKPDVKAGAKTKAVTLTLPKFSYPLPVRVAAAALLKAGRGEALDWGIYEHAAEKKSYEALLMKALGDNAIGSFKPEEMPRPVAKWLLEAKQVSAAF